MSKRGFTLLAVPAPPFSIEFWTDADGNQPVRAWLLQLPGTLRRAAGHAMNEILQHQGIDVCDSGWGRHVAPGIFEFRIDRDPSDVIDRASGRRRDDGPRRVLLRVFCHAHGDRIILLIGGYDKAADPSKKRQQDEIGVAKARLRAWKSAGKRSR